LSQSISNAEEAAKYLQDDYSLSQNIVYLNINGFIVGLYSNSEELLNLYRHYFKAVIDQLHPTETDIDILAIERPQVELAVDFHDWLREEPNKARKDAIYDLSADQDNASGNARLLKKVRTGMVFLQSQSHLIAAGECLKNANQVINFINNQYLNYALNQQNVLRQPSVLCHAAGLTYQDQALGMAAFSGGGKSTLMLHMLSQEGCRFLSNDRVILQRQSPPDEAQILATGIPKLPRVNPGTILNNPKLAHMIGEEKRRALLALPRQELWDLEDKYDVMIEDCYGPDKIQYQSAINNFLILNWSHNSTDEVSIEPVNLEQRQDLLAPIMKSPGPFYQYADGSLFQHLTPLNESEYLDIFENINTYEVCGQIDFDRLSRVCFEEILS
jgi:HprK-related kinase B